MEQEGGDGRDENRDQSCESCWGRVTVVPVACVTLSSSALSLALGHELGASHEGISRIITTLGGLLELFWIVDLAVKLHTSVDVTRAHLSENAWNAVLHKAGCGFSC